ncbi:hypothetical protein HFN88_05210 [Rhizobium laguerreae]|uniref:lipoprotein n=1 Tax=Rhizobium laguerreae TaxID=1076926 RepID=UPI001C92831A|nr:lipoprotein [Rhizobium laguerreae]MBY3329006.1 hypothetical protein [Rhizobium laguerreae]MBY3392084.1 hypothetical protein [Rhizobium laguerreae]
MNRILLTTCITAILTGCTSSVVRPSFDYAATSLGVYNSGLLNVGQLFVWDTETSTLTRLDEVPFPPAPTTRTNPTTLHASNISSLSFTAGIDSTVKANASAAIKENLSIRVQNGSREEYLNTIGLLATEINRRKAANEDVDRSWLLSQAAQQGSSLRYILVRGLVTSDKAELMAQNSSGAELSLIVPGGKGGTTKIDLSGEALASCSGSRSPCFLSLQVFQAYINESGNYDFEPVRGVATSQIADLLKSL